MSARENHLWQQAYEFCKNFALGRIQRIKNNIAAIEGSLYSETKSSAGDKHETGRAMLQLEREKLGKQLFEAEKMMAQLQRIDQAKGTTIAVPGSLVTTNIASYFIAISAGRFETMKTVIYCVSANTPIAKTLIGKTKGSTFVFNGTEHQIENIS